MTDPLTKDHYYVNPRPGAIGGGCAECGQPPMDHVRKPELVTSNDRLYRCFFCDEEFSGVDATNHFGRRDGDEPACKIKAAGEFALLDALRDAQEDLANYWAEDTKLLRAMHSMAADHQVALRRQEEKGYERGLRDAKAHPETLGLRRADETTACPHCVDGAEHTLEHEGKP